MDDLINIKALSVDVIQLISSETRFVDMNIIAIGIAIVSIAILL